MTVDIILIRAKFYTSVFQQLASHTMKKNCTGIIFKMSEGVFHHQAYDDSNQEEYGALEITMSITMSQKSSFENYRHFQGSVRTTKTAEYSTAVN